MSHVVVVDIEIKDLEMLKKACEDLGLVFKENKKTYKWYGRSVGDYKLPDGFTASELGKCEHALSIKNNDSAYEIGVVKSKKNSESYSLLWDFWNGGYGLEKVVGKDCHKLINSYSKNVARKHVLDKVKSQGWSYVEAYNDQTGETVFTLRRY